MDDDALRVLVVDDMALLRKGFRMILETEDDIEVVGEAGDGLEAVDAARRLRPDVVLMDVRMPNMDGVEATRCLTGQGEDNSPSLCSGTRPGLALHRSGPRILILTTFDLDEYVVEALRAGASGFLLKDVGPEALIEAVRVVAAGDALLAPSVTRRLLDRFATAPAPTAKPSPALASVTDRELEVLKHLAKGCSNAEIAEALYVSETTVKSHVSHLLMKLNLRDRVQAVVLAYECGVVQPGAG